jgi:cell division topological specificity factor
MLDLLQRIFGKEADRASKNIATERLRLVLMHDRIDLSPQLIDSLRSDILKVIASYLEIDEPNMEISLHRAKGSIALVANIPVVKMKRLPTVM